MKWHCWWRHVALLLLMSPVNAAAGSQDVANPFLAEQDNGPRPIDYGAGPGVPIDGMLAAPEAAPAAIAVPSGPEAGLRGVFGAAVNWPLIPLHAVLLADGRVLSYGTDERGQQGAQFIYDVWDPASGTGGTSHLVLPNTTGTDLFCSGQSVLAQSGNVLLTGGDRTIGGIRNYSDDATTIFYPRSSSNPVDELKADQPMAFRRWYPSIVPLANGDKLILGGRQDFGAGAPTPEVFSESSGWRLLAGASSAGAFGSGSAWYYPRAYKLPNDPSKVFVLGHNGKMFRLDTAGAGGITQLGKTTLLGSHKLPTVMFTPGKLLSLRTNRKVIVVDLNGTQPTAVSTKDISQVRYWANATVLADGQVLVSGGAAADNQLSGVAFAGEIWNPATGQWTLTARARKPRLYHSTALLLPDGSVLTAGGGAPGPIKNLNAEIYYPPYLYDTAGNPAVRPMLMTGPSTLRFSNPADRQFAVSVGPGDAIARVSLLRSGSATHAVNLEQRFQRLTFSQAGQVLTISRPRSPSETPPGYYLLFVFNGSGVPSVARIIRILI